MSCGPNTSYSTHILNCPSMECLQTQNFCWLQSTSPICLIHNQRYFILFLGWHTGSWRCSHSSAHPPPFLELHSESYFGNTFPRTLIHSISSASLHHLSKFWFLEMAMKFFSDLPNCSPIFSLCCYHFGCLGRGLTIFPLVTSIMHKNRTFLFSVFLE